MHNNNQWTTARYHSFIKGLLRAGMRRWGPKHTVRKAAWVKRGVYRCAGYKKRWHHAPASIKPKDKRVNNIFVDHIDPVISPHVGFVSWDVVIARMFCEVDNLQVLCKDCHDHKTKDEKEITKNRVKNESK